MLATRRRQLLLLVCFRLAAHFSMQQAWHVLVLAAAAAPTPAFPPAVQFLARFRRRIAFLMLAALLTSMGTGIALTLTEAMALASTRPRTGPRFRSFRKRCVRIF